MQIKRFLGNIARSYLVIGALSVSAVAGAEEFYPDQNWGNNWGGGCCTPQQCCEPPACGWAYNPPAYPRCGGSGGDGFMDSLSGRIDFLWWRAYEDGLALGSEEEFDVFTENELLNKSSVKRPKFKYDPGFRLGLSHYCPCDCWDIALNWTHYHTKANASGASEFADPITSGSTFIPGTSSAYALFIPYWERIRGLIPDAGKSKWSLDIDMLDLEIGRKYYVSSCFVLRPNIGLRGARIDQSYKAYYSAQSITDFSDVIDPPFNSYESFIKAKNDFLAIGPRIGLDAEFHIGCGISIFGQAAGSLLFGRFDRHAKEFHTDYSEVNNPLSPRPDPTDFVYESKSNSARCSRAVTDLAIGLKWDHCFEWCNRYHPVSLAFSWEHHAFYNFNNFNFNSGVIDSLDERLGHEIGTGSGPKRGDLYTQGLTVSLDVGF